MDVKNDVLIDRQDCLGLGLSSSTNLECVDVTRSYPRLQYVKGEGHVLGSTMSCRDRSLTSVIISHGTRSLRR